MEKSRTDGRTNHQKRESASKTRRRSPKSNAKTNFWQRREKKEILLESKTIYLTFSLPLSVSIDNDIKEATKEHRDIQKTTLKRGRGSRVKSCAVLF